MPRYGACPRGHDATLRLCSISRRGDVIVKSAALKAAPSVVSVLTYDLPDEMLRCYPSHCKVINRPSGNEAVFWGSGFVVECDSHPDGKYFATILTAATIFKRTGDIQPSEVKVNVYLAGGVRYKAEVICCDFHYNLAAIRVQADSPLSVATLRPLDDCISLDPTDLFHREYKSFQLRPHTKSMKIFPGELVVVVGRYFLNGRYAPEINPAFFSEKKVGHDCAEVYGLNCCSNAIFDDGGPVINRFGEVIGMRFHNSGPLTPFLPTNVITRWWSHQKKFGEFCHPWLGMEFCNLHTVESTIFERLPGIVNGVLVTKVQDDSPANRARIRCDDIIVQCDGIEVRSTLEFAERIWGKIGESVELKILRARKSGRGGLTKKRTLTIEETEPENFYRWRQPAWTWKKPAWALTEEFKAGKPIYDDY